MPNRGLSKDLAIVLALFVLSLLFFWPVTLGGKTLLPADNAFTWEPWRTYAAEVGVSTPHNALLSDLYLENYAWKRFIVSSLRAGQLPLWNPYILAGVPFLAAGQHSALYPLSALFYLLPIPLAFGWFAALHLFLAGTFTYLLARTLRVGRAGSLLAATAFMFCGFMVTRNVFPMIIAAAVWLPLILTSIERIVRRAEAGGRDIVAQVPSLFLGSLAFGMVFLAGHPEMYYYVALTSALFALWRLASVVLRRRSWKGMGTATGTLALMALLGLGLGCAQWLPLFQLVRHSFRVGTASFREVLGWAYPKRQIISFLLPDFFGNPSHHSYFDLFSWRVVPVTLNALGQHIDTIEWGIKNYVEGSSYVGTLPLILAVIAALARKGRGVGFFIFLAALSLAFAFGTPLYIIVYKLPGLSQVHSPFRWVYPYSLCVSILAGMGVDALWHREGRDQPKKRWGHLCHLLLDRVVPYVALLGGLVLLGGLGLSLLTKERSAALAERLMFHLSLAPQAFADGRMFYSYQVRNLVIFAVALLLGGLLLVLRKRFRGIVPWGCLAVLVVLGELFVVGARFFPAVDPALVGYRTPAIDFLTSDTDLYRVTSYVGGNEKTFNANAGMFYEIADARGYDSLIPRQYADYMKLIQEQGELQYNRIAPLLDSDPEALDSPLLDLLNVKYVLTDRERAIENEGYVLVYDEEIRIYRNEDVLPRAFLVARAVSIPDGETRREALRSFDPREVVILEESLDDRTDGVPPGFEGKVEAIDYSRNEVIISVASTASCFLVLGDSYFEGWLAFIRPTDAEEPSLEEEALHIYRADGNFRAVEIPAGRHVVRFKYSPDEVKFGLYVSFLSAMMLVLGVGLWVWFRFYGRPQQDTAVQRVTKNTVAPMALNLVNRAIDMAFAMLMLRVLGPADAGQYAFAVVVIGWFDIFVNFGLNTLLTRDIAKDKDHASGYLANAIALRTVLWGVSLPLMVTFFLVRFATKPLPPATILAISLYGLGLLPSNISASFSAVFSAHERMEIPASVTTLTTILKVCLGTIALVIGGGYVGLAATSILVNLATMGVLYYLLRKELFRPRLDTDRRFQMRMALASFPLMINQLLATLFFKVAMLLLEWLLPDPRVLGWYGAAYKYVDAVQIIPSAFTLAIFPLMARYAATGGDSLAKAYRLAVKLLIIVAVPLSLLGSGLSRELISILGGSQYLPQGAQILQIMIWYMPIGFINSVTQYVLIALNRQRFLTLAFAVGLAFNVIANVTLIAQVGFMASAYVAVASELALLVPLYLGIRKYLAHMPWFHLTWKQGASALPMALMFLLLPHRYLGLALGAGLVAYIIGLYMLQVFDANEREVVGRVLPLGRLGESIANKLKRSIDPAIPPD